MVDSLIGKLRALFNESGRRGEWEPRLLIGNPATDISLKQYLKAVSAEQLQAQITPTQATPVFVHDLVPLSHCLDKELCLINFPQSRCLFSLETKPFLKLCLFQWG